MDAIARYRRLLEYEAEANARSIASLASVAMDKRQSPAYQRAIRLIPHNTLARRVWLWRIEGAAYDNPTDWFPAHDLDRTRRDAAEADRLWGEFLGRLREAEVSREVVYASSEGVRYASTIDDILTHVFNHSTYHRGQVARLVAECAGVRASTDYIAITRRAL